MRLVQDNDGGAVLNYRRHNRNHRRRNMSTRVLVDGALVAPVPNEKHGCHDTYVRLGCRCRKCTEARAAYMKEFRGLRRSVRVVINSQLVAPVPDERHGLLTTYDLYACRCDRCRAAKAASRGPK